MSAAQKTFTEPENTQNSDLPHSYENAQSSRAVYAMPIWQPGWSVWKRTSGSGLRDWREKRRRRLLRRGARTFRGWGRGRPIQRFGEAVKKLTRGAFHGYAAIAETIEKHAAIGSVELEKIRAPHQV